MGSQPLTSRYLFGKASINKTPLSGTFEISPLCNMDCKMCYIKLNEKEMKEKGLSLFILQKQENRALIYVCRMKKLQQDLEKPGVMNLLRKYGYQDTDPHHAISHLIERLEENGTFPHEIGLFLGYPLDDVIGFIVNKGKNCHCIGCWKVYCNKEEAERTFCKYKKCTDVYNRLWRNGRSIQKLTVA